jgi:hypothetical protein
MTNSSIPTTYEEWVQCITVKYKISLTPEFARARLAALDAPQSAEAATFVARYGEAHLTRIIEWYRRVAG